MTTECHNYAQCSNYVGYMMRQQISFCVAWCAHHSFTLHSATPISMVESAPLCTQTKTLKNIKFLANTYDKMTRICRQHFTQHSTSAGHSSNAYAHTSAYNARARACNALGAWVGVVHGVHHARFKCKTRKLCVTPSLALSSIHSGCAACGGVVSCELHISQEFERGNEVLAREREKDRECWASSIKT